MRDRGGKIINFGSELSLHPQDGRRCYAASKGAIQAFTRSLAWEWGRHNINVNCVWPSAVTLSWQRWEAIDPEGVQRVLETEMAIKRRGDPEMDVGRAVMFLASGASDLGHRSNAWGQRRPHLRLTGRPVPDRPAGARPRFRAFTRP
jgi:NAD(P)-dependent dehydrogenase (short-subunit alcohol dehydrogenase family)